MATKQAAPTLDQLTDAQLDEAVAREVMGIEPTLSWELSADGGKSSRIGFGSKSEADEYLAESKRRSIHQECEVVAWKHWPRYSTSPADAFGVVEKMKQDGWTWVGVVGADASDSTFVRKDSEKRGFSEGQALPRAICEAALKAVRLFAKAEQA